jgi:MFS transporter, FSR family, fosmidomycin resistance protein
MKRQQGTGGTEPAAGTSAQTGGRTGGSAAGEPGPGAAASAVPAAVVVVAVAHGLNDAYAAFLHPLLPRLMERLGLSIALAATLAMTLSIAASLLQPVMGHLSDRYGRRAFVVLGPLASAVFLSSMGLAPNLAVLLLLLALGGLGSAAFHPPGASLSARVGAGRGSGVRLSVFSFGGAVGYAVGPLAAVAIVGQVGLEGLWIAMLPALGMAVVVYLMVPSDRAAAAAAPPPPGPREVLRLLRGPLGVVFGISAIFAFVQRVFLTMEPIVIAAAGGSEAAGALSLSVYLGGTAAGTLTGGFLSDRMDRRVMLFGIGVLTVPAHLLALGLPPGTGIALVFAALAGFLNMAVLPPIVVIAQEIMPRGAAVGSGIVMGLAWALGSVGVLFTGMAGDVFGARTAALGSVPLALAAAALALHPALRRHRRAHG